MTMSSWLPPRAPAKLDESPLATRTPPSARSVPHPRIARCHALQPPGLPSWSTPALCQLLLPPEVPLALNTCCVARAAFAPPRSRRMLALSHVHPAHYHTPCITARRTVPRPEDLRTIHTQAPCPGRLPRRAPRPQACAGRCCPQPDPTITTIHTCTGGCGSGRGAAEKYADRAGAHCRAHGTMR